MMPRFFPWTLALLVAAGGIMGAVQADGDFTAAPSPTPAPAGRDRKPPVITVYGGTNRTTYGDSLLIGGRVTDNVSVASLQVKTRHHHYEDIPQKGYWATTVSLKTGKNVFVIRATDSSGKRATRRIVVTRLLP